MLAADPVVPLSQHQTLLFLLQLATLLALAFAAGRLAMRAGMPAVVGELSAGLLAGPSVLGHLAPGFSAWLLPSDPAQFHLLDAFGQVAVLLLVGLTGVQLDLRLLRRRRAAAASVGTLGLVLPLALGVAAGYLSPAALLPGTADRTAFALFMGVALCVSALPVIAKTLADLGILHRDVGQLTMAAGTVDDIVGWLLLSVVSAMASTGVHAADVTRSVACVVLVVVAAPLVGRPLARLLVGGVTRRTPDAGPVAAVVVVMLLLSAAATQAMGLEAILGAFVCGLVISSVPELEPARLSGLNTVVMSVLAPVFFASAGLRMDLAALRDPVLLAAAAVVLVVAVAGKFAGAYAGARLSGVDHRSAIALGAGLNARGAVEVIVATVGLRLGVLDSRTYTVIVLVAIATSLMAPPILRRHVVRIAPTPEEDLRRHRLLASVPGAGGDAPG